MWNENENLFLNSSLTNSCVHFQVFDGNFDHDTIVYHHLNPPITARYLRIKPTSWQYYIAMRMEFYTYQGILFIYLFLYFFLYLSAVTDLDGVSVGGFSG